MHWGRWRTTTSIVAMAGSPCATPRLASRAVCPCLRPPGRRCVAMCTGATGALRSRTAPALSSPSRGPVCPPGRCGPRASHAPARSACGTPPTAMGHVGTTFGTAAPCTRGCVGLGRASMSNATGPSCRPPSGRSRSALPLGICAPPRRGSAWPPNVWRRCPGGRCQDHDPLLAELVGNLLHRALGPPTAGQSPHHCQLPRHLLPAVALGPATAAPSACSLDTGRAGGTGARRVSGVSGTSARYPRP